jgi:hypothetical protein
MKTIIASIKLADDVQIDASWAILKYKSIGILRKLKCLAWVLDADEEEVIKEAPKDKDGRILDHETRHAIHDELIQISQKQKQ